MPMVQASAISPGYLLLISLGVELGVGCKAAPGSLVGYTHAIRGRVRFLLFYLLLISLGVELGVGCEAGPGSLWGRPMPSAGECVSPGDLLLISVEVEVGGKAGTSRFPGGPYSCRLRASAISPGYLLLVSVEVELGVGCKAQFQGPCGAYPCRPRASAIPRAISYRYQLKLEVEVGCKAGTSRFHFPGGPYSCHSRASGIPSTDLLLISVEVELGCKALPGSPVGLTDAVRGRVRFPW
jgi:hypothetical protein